MKENPVTLEQAISFLTEDMKKHSSHNTLGKYFQKPAKLQLLKAKTKS